MASIRELLPLGRPEVAYLFPELDVKGNAYVERGKVGINPSGSDLFVFQYWPTQLQDDYQVDYATKPIPGGSHPLYQWSGGAGRIITFDAVFTSELDDSTTGSLTSLTPSSRYSVNVAGAIAALRAYQHPTYRDGARKGIAEPPKRLHLVFPGTKIGGDSDEILCFLKNCRVTIESCFPSGAIRVATVSLEFIQTVQKSTGNTGASRVEFVGTTSFVNTAKEYKYTGS